LSTLSTEVSSLNIDQGRLLIAINNIQRAVSLTTSLLLEISWPPTPSRSTLTAPPTIEELRLRIVALFAQVLQKSTIKEKIYSFAALRFGKRTSWIYGHFFYQIYGDITYGPKKEKDKLVLHQQIKPCQCRELISFQSVVLLLVFWLSLKSNPKCKLPI
jgi:hypothetical protein